MTTNDAIGILDSSETTRFLANVIQCWHASPAKKLTGAARLVLSGHDVRIGREIDILMIDGSRADWTSLETVNMSRR